MTPLRVPPPPPLWKVPVVAGVKPVPVKVTMVPEGAPVARSAGVCEETTGPATVKAAANAALS